MSSSLYLFARIVNHKLDALTWNKGISEHINEDSKRANHPYISVAFGQEVAHLLQNQVLPLG